MSRRDRLALAAGFALLLAAGIAEARPAGGQSYSGGSSRSNSGSSSTPSSGGSSRSGGFSSGGYSSSGGSSTSSGGGSSGGQGNVGFLMLGFIVFVGISVVRHMAAAKQQGGGWSTAEPERAGAPPTHHPIANVRAEVESIRELDPDFSIVLLEDFLAALITEVHMQRGLGNLDRLEPWLGPRTRKRLLDRTEGVVESVVIGAIRFHRYSPSDARLKIGVEVELCYVEGGQGRWAVERWSLSRPPDRRSRPPEQVRVFECPGCGGSLDKMVGGKCRHCSRVVDDGFVDWVVSGIAAVSIEPGGPDLTGYAPEQGTDLETIVDPALERALRALRKRDTTFSDAGLEARVGLIFETLQSAWTSLEWERARPYLSDNLFQAQRYWIEAYRSSGLRNVTANTRILSIEQVRLTEDRWFDAFTVRLEAKGLDYTIRDVNQEVVGGSKRRHRRYTEYWTLIRGRGTAKATHDKPECPSCGAPIAVSMAAVCKHCKAKVNSGEFDWVLARIEQDEAYAG